VQHAQKVLELIQLSWTVSENWRGLTHLHIRLTKVALLIGDVLAFALAALLAAVLARPGAISVMRNGWCRKICSVTGLGWV